MSTLIVVWNVISVIINTILAFDGTNVVTRVLSRGLAKINAIIAIALLLVSAIITTMLHGNNIPNYISMFLWLGLFILTHFSKTRYRDSRVLTKNSAKITSKMSEAVGTVAGTVAAGPEGAIIGNAVGKSVGCVLDESANQMTDVESPEYNDIKLSADMVLKYIPKDLISKHGGDTAKAALEYKELYPTQYNMIAEMQPRA